MSYPVHLGADVVAAMKLKARPGVPFSQKATQEMAVAMRPGVRYAMIPVPPESPVLARWWPIGAQVPAIFLWEDGHVQQESCRPLPEEGYTSEE
jgi:hypothetical protein